MSELVAIVHTADIHIWNEGTHSNHDEIVLAFKHISREIRRMKKTGQYKDVILFIGGDVMNQIYCTSLDIKTFNDIVNILNLAKIPTIMIPGNHDVNMRALNANDESDLLQTLMQNSGGSGPTRMRPIFDASCIGDDEMPTMLTNGYVHYFPYSCRIEGCGLEFYHVSVYDNRDRDELEEFFERMTTVDTIRDKVGTIPYEPHILLYHGAIYGGKYSESSIIERDSRISNSVIRRTRAVLAGDFHMQQIFGPLSHPVGYSGSLLTTTIAEGNGGKILIWEVPTDPTALIEEPWSMVIHQPRVPRRIIVDDATAIDEIIDGVVAEIDEISKVVFVIDIGDIPIDYVRTYLKSAAHDRLKGIPFTITTKKFTPDVTIDAVAPNGDGEWNNGGEHDLSAVETEKTNISSETIVNSFTKIVKDIVATKSKMVINQDGESIRESFLTSEQISNVVSRFANNVSQSRHSWSIVSGTWSNIGKYGAGNKIDFGSLSGIVGISAPNTGGKSTIIDILVYALFNSTLRMSKNGLINWYSDRGEISILIRVNTATTNNASGDSADDVNTGDANSGGIQVKKGTSTGYKLYRILREVSGKANTTFCEVMIEGGHESTVKNLTGNTIAETYKNIASLIGTKDEFLSTVAVVGEMSNLLLMGDTERIRILGSMMGLGSLDELTKSVKKQHLVLEGQNKALTEPKNPAADFELAANCEKIKLAQMADLETELAELRGRKKKLDRVVVDPTTLRWLTEMNSKAKAAEVRARKFRARIIGDNGDVDGTIDLTDLSFIPTPAKWLSKKNTIDGIENMRAVVDDEDWEPKSLLEMTSPDISITSIRSKMPDNCKNEVDKVIETHKKKLLSHAREKEMCETVTMWCDAHSKLRSAIDSHMHNSVLIKSAPQLRAKLKELQEAKAERVALESDGDGSENGGDIAETLQSLTAEIKKLNEQLKSLNVLPEVDVDVEIEKLDLDGISAMKFNTKACTCCAANADIARDLGDEGQARAEAIRVAAEKVLQHNKISTKKRTKVEAQIEELTVRRDELRAEVSARKTTRDAVESRIVQLQNEISNLRDIISTSYSLVGIDSADIPRKSSIGTKSDPHFRQYARGGDDSLQLDEDTITMITSLWVACNADGPEVVAPDADTPLTIDSDIVIFGRTVLKYMARVLAEHIVEVGKRVRSECKIAIESHEQYAKILDEMNNLNEEMQETLQSIRPNKEKANGKGRGKSKNADAGDSSTTISIEDISATLEELDNVGAEIKRVEGEIAVVKVTLTSIDKERAVLSERQKTYDEWQAKFGPLQRELREIEVFKAAITSTQLNTMIVSENINNIVSLANALLDEAFAKFQLGIVVKESKVEFKILETLPIDPADGIVRVCRLDASSGSGYQKFVSTIALRMAIASLLPGAADFMIIDEGFREFDADNLSRIPKFLEAAASRFRFIVVMSSIPTVILSATRLLKIEFHDGCSYIGVSSDVLHSKKKKTTIGKYADVISFQ